MTMMMRQRGLPDGPYSANDKSLVLSPDDGHQGKTTEAKVDRPPADRGSKIDLHEELPIVEDLKKQ